MLIFREYVFLDATGMFGVFYDRNHQISSSLNVLRKLNDLPIKYPDIYHGIFPDFVPGTYTKYDEIRRLLPSQVYNYDTSELISRPLLPDGIAEYKSDSDRIAAFIKYYTTSLSNMSRVFADKKFCLALTGGYDSRTTLSMLISAGLDFEIFTLEYDDIPLADTILPQIIAERLNKKWRYIRRKFFNYSLFRARDYMIHTAGMAVDQDRSFYAYKQYQALRDNGTDIVILRSGIYECSVEYYAHYIDTQKSPTKENCLELFKANNYVTLLNDSASRWFNTLETDEYNREIGIFDRIYWEMRDGCWLSSIEQGFDMMDGIISIQPANCRLFLSILMGFDQEKRKSKAHQAHIIETATPVLADIPFADGYMISANIRMRIKRKILRQKLKFEKYIWLLRHYGVIKTVTFRMNK